MNTNPRHQRPRSRLSKTVILSAATLCITAGFMILGGWFSPIQSYQVLDPRHAIRRHVLASPSSHRATCSAPIVDWSQFQGFQAGSAAGVFAEDLNDPAIPWVLYGLKARNYAVRFFVEAANAEAAYSVLQKNALQDTVTVEVVKVHEYLVSASVVHMFVYLPMDENNVVAGPGSINWILLPDDIKLRTAHVKSAAGGGKWSAGASQREAPAVRQRTRMLSGRPPTSAGHFRMQSDERLDAAASSTTAVLSQDLALSTYDYMLYRSIEDLASHMQILTPVFERLQGVDKVFPLVDLLTIPEVPSEQSVKAYQGQFDQMAHRSGLNKVFRFFLQSTLSFYKARLTPATQSMRDARARKVHQAQGDATYAAVIVEARPHFAFLYTVLNAVWYVPGWTMNIVHTRLNADFVRHTLSPYVHAEYHQLDTDNLSIDEYNNLLKSRTFWEMLKADYILLFQTDSLILRPGAEAFAHFDYIGAPWHLQNERWSQPALRAALPDGVGNGGFSVRSAKAMIAVCERYGPHSAVSEHEDLFYVLHIQEDPRFRLADRISAYRFCLEVPCSDLNFNMPFGIHAAWYYNDLPMMRRLLDASLHGLADCE